MSVRRPHTLICTVGTSLFDNLQRLSGESTLCQLRSQENWRELARQLAKRDPNDRICGAEINSIASLQQRGLLAPEPLHLHFCCSDTEDGRRIGQVLKWYYQRSGHRVEVHVFEDLQDAAPERFRTAGLRNLARSIGRIVRNFGRDYVAINATGGYKAQIAIAVLIGQALEIPVYYKHERFDTVVAFPPMPISFDWDLLGQFADLIHELEGEVIRLPAAEVPEKLRPLLEEAPEEGGESLWTLAPIGQIYLEGFRHRYPPERTLPPDCDPADRSPPSFPDHHYPIGFRDFVHRLWQELPYCRTCRAIPYDGQQAIRHLRFRIDDNRIIGEYRDRNAFGARFEIVTTATSNVQRVALVQDLYRRFGRKT